jgi:hypothetical protein
MAGCQVFTRVAPFWQLYPSEWVYTLAPYTVLFGFIILLTVQLVRLRMDYGFWTLGIPSLVKIDLTTGAAGEFVTPLVGAWEKAFDELLNPF